MASDLKLTRVQRIILKNQYEILASLEKTSRYDNKIDILTNGDTVFYGEIANLVSNEMDRDDGKFVLDVLEMYRAMHRVDEAIFFPGFDGFSEPRHLDFARRQILRPNYWDEQKPFEHETNRWNTQRPTLHVYRRQSKTWRASADMYELTPEDVARIRPTRR